MIKHQFIINRINTSTIHRINTSTASDNSSSCFVNNKWCICFNRRWASACFSFGHVISNISYVEFKHKSYCFLFGK